MFAAACWAYCSAVICWATCFFRQGNPPVHPVVLKAAATTVRLTKRDSFAFIGTSLLWLQVEIVSTLELEYAERLGKKGRGRRVSVITEVNQQGHRPRVSAKLKK